MQSSAGRPVARSVVGWEPRHSVVQGGGKGSKCTVHQSRGLWHTVKPKCTLQGMCWGGRGTGMQRAFGEGTNEFSVVGGGLNNTWYSVGGGCARAHRAAGRCTIECGGWWWGAAGGPCNNGGG